MNLERHYTEGHGLSRAAAAAKNQGLQPLRPSAPTRSEARGHDDETTLPAGPHHSVSHKDYEEIA